MKDSSILWYKKPAEYWVQALPVGNGTLGGMIYGGVTQEKIALNHDELWTGHPKDTTRPGAAEAFKKARECKGKPTAIVQKSTKGKGVSFMENQVSWHGSAPNAEQYEEAMAELNAKLKELEA